jgi:hypothetical protein
MLERKRSRSSSKFTQRKMELREGETKIATSPKKSSSTTTNHVDAAVDALVAVTADAVIGADYSTFTRAIQIRKCVRYFQKQHHASQQFEALMLYNHKLTKIREIGGKGWETICYKRTQAEREEFAARAKSNDGFQNEGDPLSRSEMFLDDGAGGVYENPFVTMPHAYAPTEEAEFRKEDTKCV